MGEYDPYSDPDHPWYEGDNFDPYGNNPSPEPEPEPVDDDPEGEKSPVERMADISREMWEDYVARFQPLEDRLISSKMNWDEKGSVDEAANIAETSFDVSRGILDRDLSRYGLGLTGDERVAVEKTTALDEAAAVADAKNLARLALSEYQNTY